MKTFYLFIIIILTWTSESHATLMPHDFPSMGKDISYQTKILEAEELSVLSKEQKITENLAVKELESLVTKHTEGEKLFNYYLNLFEDISFSYQKDIDITEGVFGLNFSTGPEAGDMDGDSSSGDDPIQVTESANVDTIMFFIPLVVVGGLIFGFYQVRGGIFFICFWIIFWYPIKDFISFITSSF